MEQIITKQYTKYTLEFIFSEANKMATHILDSISENRKKSFFLFAFTASILSYSFLKITECDYSYFVLLIGSIVSLWFLRNNLFPQTVTFNGALPENMINPYFNNFTEEKLEKEYLATQIETYNSSMSSNRVQMSKMVSRFKTSAVITLVSFFVFGFFFLFGLVESLPA
jgi:hypothetical protein